MTRYKLIETSLIVVLGILLGCSITGPRSNAYLVFIDYSKSASTFTSENPAKIESLLNEIATELRPQDFLEVFPIHAYTESAAFLLRLQGPELKGDLRDKKLREDWMNNQVIPKIKKIWDTRIRDDRKLSTNIYPILHKVEKLTQRGYDVGLYLISDMVQDHAGESFQTIFGNNSNRDPKKYAQVKISTIQFEDTLGGVHVFVKIPGTPQGNSVYDKIKERVSEFWEEFFILCGAKVVIEDL